MAKESEATGGTGLDRWFWVALGVLALGGVGFLLFAGGGGPEPVGPLSQAEVSVPPDSGAFAAAVGSEDAPVTVAEFADYTCPHCAQFASLPGPALRRDYAREGQVRFLFYDFPLSEQSNAIPAALAARCAGAQDAFWEMHGVLFSNQRAWAADQTPEDRFADYAKQAGLDVGQFNDCYSERRFLGEIFASRGYGRQLAVSGTPTIFVNGRKARTYAYEDVSALIEAELDSTAAGGASGSAAAGGASGSATTGGGASGP